MKKSYIQPRSVAVAIPYTITAAQPNPSVVQNHVQICLVSSRKHPGDFVLPKGGVREAEDTLTAAVRELYEEAGLKAVSHWQPVSTTSPNDLVVADHKPHKNSPSEHHHDPAFVPRAIYTAHEVLVDDKAGELPDWPEQDERVRQWFPLNEALQRIAWRNDIATLLQLWARGIPE